MSQTKQTKQTKQTTKRELGIMSAFGDAAATVGIGALGIRVLSTAILNQVVNADAALSVAINEGISSMSDTAQSKFNTERQAKLQKYNLDDLI